MKKSSVKFLLICGILLMSSLVQAQFSKKHPLDLLDKNCSVYYSFSLNETEEQKQSMINKFVDYLLAEGFNVVKVEESVVNGTQDYIERYERENKSLNITYEIIAMTHPSRCAIVLTPVSPRAAKPYMGKTFGQAFEQFKLDVTIFKPKDPTVNQEPFDASVLKKNSPDSSTADSTDEEPFHDIDFSEKVTFINELPSDLATSTLVVVLFDEMEVAAEDTSKISAEELIRRRERTQRFKNKNNKYKERFKEYPYSICSA